MVGSAARNPAKCVVYTLHGGIHRVAPTTVPSYRLHKPTNQAIVVIRGKTFYLGRYGSVESRSEYNRIVAEWLAIGGQTPPAASARGIQSDLTVAELILAFWGHVQSYYTKDGEPTSEVDTIRQALRPVRELYGHTTARNFGPLALKACQDAMIAKGWARTYINRQVNRVRAHVRVGGFLRIASGHGTPVSRHRSGVAERAVSRQGEAPDRSGA